MKLHIILLAIFLITGKAQAGAVKELLIEHEDAVQREVSLMSGYSYDRLFKTEFVKAPSIFELAMESLVVIIDQKGFAVEIICTSYFQTDSTGSYQEVETSCESPE